MEKALVICIRRSLSVEVMYNILKGKWMYATAIWDMIMNVGHVKINKD